MRTDPPRPEEHSPSCLHPGYEWQQVVVEGLPRRGRCRGCGAVTIHRERRAGVR